MEITTAARERRVPEESVGFFGVSVAVGRRGLKKGWSCSFFTGRLLVDRGTREISGKKKVLHGLPGKTLLIFM
ncbi:hypothetical protein, partial [Pseudomonas brenneri]|uniref:hypothetical protein n=1 Tax=Pseudomonas brenneri TaxID=129817 RepID=UPI0028D555FD